MYVKSDREAYEHDMVEIGAIGGAVAYSDLPYWLSDDECEAEFQRRAEKDRKRIALGFQLPKAPE